MNRTHGELVTPALRRALGLLLTPALALAAPLRTAVAVALALLAVAPAAALATPPDPLARGPYAVTTVDPVRIGTVNLQEPNAAGGALTGAAAAATLQIRGSIYY